jgi:EAL and modified HD-GYP domain-containing signal transduction protein
VSDAFVARQPIFDRQHELVGYELLYRPSLHAAGAGPTDDLKMTSVTLVNTVLAIGMENTTDGQHAWVNFPRELLLEHDFDLLDPKRFTIEMLETVACDEETIAACVALKAKGFSLALDDFAAGDEYAPFLELANTVKIDVMATPPEQIRALVKRLASTKVQLLAEKVDNAAMYMLCRELGFALFQGYYFSKPEIVKRKDLPAEALGIARLMNRLVDGKTHDRELEQEFRGDPGLSYKLLRIVNSAAAGGSGIESIQQAIRLVGRGALHRWLALMFASSTPRKTGVEAELVLSAIERARLCEMMAQRSGRAAAAASLFMTGLLSRFDAILGVTMSDLLKSVKVAPEVEAALLREEGPYTPYLTLASSYASGDWVQAIELGSRMGLLDQMPEWTSEASMWARNILQRA